MIQQGYLFLNYAITNNSYKIFKELTIVDEVRIKSSVKGNKNKHNVSSMKAMYK